MDVRVGEAREDAASAEIDSLRARQSGLVRADPAGDPVAGDRERCRLGQGRVERADDAVVQDHEARIVKSPWRADAPGDGRGVTGGVGASRMARHRAAVIRSAVTSGSTYPNMSGFCWTMPMASVSPVATMCLYASRKSEYASS